MDKNTIWATGLIALLAALPAMAVDGSRAQAGNAAAKEVASGVGTATTAAALPAVASLNEGFDDVTLLEGLGWFQQNLSAPVGDNPAWTQGNALRFSAYQGAPDAYIAARSGSVAGDGTISSWLMTPELDFGRDATLTFWTRKSDEYDYPERLEVRLSINGASTNAGSTAESVGDFSTVLLSINPTLVGGVYPKGWTRYRITNADGLPRNGSGRVAFRYFVTSGGVFGWNSDYIGVDSVSYSVGRPQYQVTAAVTGLLGDGVGLRLNGGAEQVITADGSYVFPGFVDDGGGFIVAVTSQPAHPKQTCVATPTNGAIASADVNIAVTCTIDSLQVIADVAGLVGDGVGLSLNGGPEQLITVDGNHAFPQLIEDGGAFAVTVTSQPAHPKQTCEAMPASGTIDSDDAIVAVSCSTDPFVLNLLGGDGQEVLIHESFPQALEVELLDAAGDPVAGAPVTFDAPTAGASAWLHDLVAGPATTLVTTTSAEGIATVHAVANGEGGCYGVTAGHPHADPVAWQLGNIWYASVFSDGFETPPALRHGISMCEPEALRPPLR